MQNSKATMKAFIIENRRGTRRFHAYSTSDARAIASDMARETGESVAIFAARQGIGYLHIGIEQAHPAPYLTR